MTLFDALIPLTAILIGGLVLIIPLAGLTARFALKPLVEAYGRSREASGSEDRIRGLDRRIALLEDQLEALERDNARLLEDAEFRLRLAEAR
jgi:hypothetical protein